MLKKNKKKRLLFYLFLIICEPFLCHMKNAETLRERRSHRRNSETIYAASFMFTVTSLHEYS